MATSTEYDQCLVALRALKNDFPQGSPSLNEADTRFKIIDRLFLDVLAWDRSDFDIERHHDSEYTDYEFTYPRRILVVEAKREGASFTVPLGLTGLKHRLRSIRRENAGLDAAIAQVSGYCRKRGVPLAAVANGSQLVLFVANRTDGIPPDDGYAFVFDSWDALIGNFRQLWDFLAKPAIGEQALYKALVSGDTGAVPPKLSASILNYPGIKGRNSLQTDLRIVSELVFEGAPKDRLLEADFLRACYCQSGALPQYSLASKAILKARYASLFDSNDQQPTVVAATNKRGINPEFSDTAAAVSNSPILLIGDVGVGKTTFIRNLMVLDTDHLFETAIVLYIDLGSGATLTEVSRFILSEIERQLIDDYDVDPYEDGVVRGVYDLELKRFSKGIFKILRETDPAAFAREELKFLEKKINNTDEHLRAVLEHIVKGRRKQVVVFVDNADQRDDVVQQDAFLVAQELAERWPVTVFLALRPETFHASTKRGALSGYHPKAFTIEPPRIDLALKARIRFAKRLSRGEFHLESLAGVGLRIESLHALLEVVEKSLDRNPELIVCIESISKANVRMALQMLSDFFGSGHVDTEKILATYEDTGSYFVPLHEMLRAITYGDNEYYDPERSPIANLFDVYGNDPKEHFILPFLLWFLYRPGSAASDSGFVESGVVYEKTQSLGFTPGQIDHAILRSLRSGLIETAGRRIRDDEVARSTEFRITSVGNYHIARLIGMFTYIDAVIVDTPVFDESTRNDIRSGGNLIDQRLTRAKRFVSYLSNIWASSEFGRTDFDWALRASEAEDEIERISVKVGQRSMRW